MSALSDADQIRNLIALHSHAADVSDGPALQTLFAPGGIVVQWGVEIPSDRMAELVAHLTSLLPDDDPRRGIRHFQSNTAFISLEDDTASTVTDFALLDLTPERGWSVGGTGQFFDDFVKVDDAWLYQRHDVKYYRGLGRDPADPSKNRIAEVFRSFAARLGPAH